MNLRNQLLLLFSALTLLMMAVIGWASLSLSRSVIDEVDQMALEIGQNVASVVVMQNDQSPLSTVEKSAPIETKQIVISQGKINKEIKRLLKKCDGDCEQDSSDLSNLEKQLQFTIKDEIKQLSDKIAGRSKSMSFEFQTDEQETQRFEIRLDSDTSGRSLQLSGPGVSERIKLQNSGIDQLLNRFTVQLIWVMIAVLIIGLIITALLVYRVTQPLHALSYSAQKIGQGALGKTVQVNASGEVGEAIQAFNKMSLALKKLDASNQRLRAQAHLSELGEIARGLAHSLRNPLNTLGLSLETLANTADSDQSKRDQLAIMAKEQIKRIDTWIKTLLSLADQGMQQTTINIVEILQDIQLECSTHPVTIEYHCNHEKPSIVGISAEIKMMLQALIVNAVEASPEHSTVQIKIEIIPDYCQLLIIDEGPGLPVKVKQNLFSPHLTTKTYGAGMGIYLTHRLAVNRYNGSLEFFTNTPTGTQAQLRLGRRS